LLQGGIRCDQAQIGPDSLNIGRQPCQPHSNPRSISVVTEHSDPIVEPADDHIQVAVLIKIPGGQPVSHIRFQSQTPAARLHGEGAIAQIAKRHVGQI